MMLLSGEFDCKQSKSIIMKALVERYGKLITASILLMETGAVVILLTPLTLLLWDADIDIFGAIILVTGALLYATGLIIRKSRSKKH
jgi:hypothetical protein